MHATYGKSSNLDTLVTELDTLSNKYRGLLEQESVSRDVQCLKNWIKSYKRGRVDAAEAINEHGYDLLSNIKRKLKSAEREIQRIDAESPTNAQHSEGQTAHRISRAIASADNARDLIKQVTNNEINA